MHVETVAFIADNPEIDGQRSFAVGRQRFVRHLSVPDDGRSHQWDHAETYCETCQACQVIIASIGLEEFRKNLAVEAPME